MKTVKNKFSQYEEINEDYSTKTIQAKLSVPSNFRMLCALFETTAEQILTDFMWKLSAMPGVGTAEERRAAIQYILSAGLGQKIYSKEEIIQIFTELEAKQTLWPPINDPVMTQQQRDLHYHWGHMYIEYWFEKWYRKHRRAGVENPMARY
jgi:hypothetical protein